KRAHACLCSGTIVDTIPAVLLRAFVTFAEPARYRVAAARRVPLLALCVSEVPSALETHGDDKPESKSRANYFWGLASLSWRFQSRRRASAPAASASLIKPFF